MKLYDTLGVAVNAAKSEIKKAYRKMAKQHHPDKGGDEEMFKQIQKAYDVLGDDIKRDHYDKTGDENHVKDEPEKVLMAIFAAIIDSGDFHGNIIDRIADKINLEISNLKARREKGVKETVKLSKMLERVSTDGENLFEMVLNASIDKISKKLDSLDKELEQMEEMLTQVANYSDDKPEMSIEPAGLNALEAMMRDAQRQGGMFSGGPFR